MRYIELLRDYFVTGGMPAVVQEFSQTGDYGSVREMQNSILHQYEGDFTHSSAGNPARAHGLELNSRSAGKGE